MISDTINPTNPITKIPIAETFATELIVKSVYILCITVDEVCVYVSLLHCIKTNNESSKNKQFNLFIIIVILMNRLY